MWVKMNHSQNQARNNRLVPNWERCMTRLYICHSAYLTYIQSTSCEMLGWIKHKLESRMLGEINNLIYADDTTLMAESEEELKSLLMRMKEDSEKVGFKLSIKKIKIIASGPITSWQIEGGKVETVTDFIFLGFKITVDGDSSHEIKRHLLLGKL